MAGFWGISKMRRSVGLSVLFAASLMGGTAMAADLILPPILQPAAMAWTGFHIGVHAGVGMGNLGYTQDQFDPDPDTYYEYATEFALGGVQFGYDHQFADRWVIGAEVEASKLTAEYVVNEGFPPLFSADWQASLTARLGYLPTPDTMLYVRGGVAAIGTRSEDGFGNTSSGSVLAGRIGVGAETFLTDSLSARIEANYFMPSEEFLPNDGESFSPRMLTVTAGLNYNFGGETSSYPATAEPAIDWNGFYAGVSGGFNAGLMIRDTDVPLTDVGPWGSDDFSFGGYVGYNFLLSPALLAGIELEGNWQNHEFFDPMGGGILVPPETLFATIGESAGLSARFGFLTNPSTLVYGKLGAGVIRTTVNEDFYAVDGDDSFSQLLPTVQIGAGIEAAIADNTTLRVEGIYTRALDGVVVNNSQLSQIDTHTPHMLTGRVGLAWHF
jgi:opacity protein-like surface antigen